MPLPLLAFIFIAGIGIVTARWLTHEKPNLSLVVLLVLCLALALRSGGAARALDVRLDSVPRMSAAYALQQVRDGRAVLVDVRAAVFFEKGHIKGAINIPYSEVRDRVSLLPRDKTAVLYCACHNEHQSARVALALSELGARAVAMMGGYDAAVTAGFEVEGQYTVRGTVTPVIPARTPAASIPMPSPTTAPH